jgi:hypothetical protein
MPPRVPILAPIAKCQKCVATHALTSIPLTDIDAGFAELLAAGWLHMARKGQGREKWAWWCPACKPVGGGSPGAPFSRGPWNERFNLVDDVSKRIAEVATAKGLENTRTASKVNERGELVVALIVPPRRDGEWDP